METVLTVWGNQRLLWRLEVFLALEKSVRQRYVIDWVNEAYVQDVLFCSNVIV